MNYEKFISKNFEISERIKLLFNDNCYDLGDLYMQIKNSHERDPYNKIEVSFESKLEY